MTQQRHAYLIGANGPQQSQITPLQYAEQDVKRLEQAFRGYPCQFSRAKSVIADASIAVMEELEEFAEACHDADLLVVHFSGHAKSENGELYLIRNNSVFQENGRLRFATTLKIRDIKEILERCRARHKLLILDCCYSGTALGGGANKGNDEIEETLEQLRGSTSAMLTACSFREKARELDTLNDGQGGGFLSWVVASACTDHFGVVAREDALSLTDIWTWLENTALNLVNGNLPQSEQIPRPHLLNNRVAGIDNEIWFTDNRRTFHDDTFTAEQRQREELALAQQEEFLQQYCIGASVRDFDHAKVRAYAKLQRDSDQLPMQDIRNLCKRLGLTSDQYTPRRSAVLAFHRVPSRYLHSALVRVTMRGLSSDKPYRRDDIEGSLSEQAERTIEWLTKNLNTVSENVDAGQRIDRCEIPERALRELVVNALLHRNYNARESVHIEITPQQVTITNPGHLDLEIEHVEPPFSYQYSHPQNPVLLRMLVAQRWAEGRSLGFRIVREEFGKYELPLPKICNLPNGLVLVVIQRPENSVISRHSVSASEGSLIQYDISQKQMERLTHSVDKWNQWRQEQPEMRPDLSSADLSRTDLSRADLHEAILSETNFSEADFSEANLNRVILRGANLNDANFANVRFASTIFAGVDLSKAKGLETAIHEDTSSVDINSVMLPTDEHTRNHFLRGVGFTETQIEYLPALLTPRPIQYHSLFISYVHQDESIAKRLYADFRKNDVPCWFALHDLRPGTHIVRGIDEAIHLQDKFLLILSNHALGSQWIEREVEEALHQEIQRGQDVLFPIRLDNAILQSQASWAIRLLHRHIGDFTGWQDETAYQQAFATLLRHLKVTEPPTV